MSTQDIHAHVRELYGLVISLDPVSAVTDSVLGEVKAWQSRPPDSAAADRASRDKARPEVPPATQTDARATRRFRLDGEGH